MTRYGLAADNLLEVELGDADEAKRDLDPFKAWGSPLVVDVGPMPYAVMNTLLDGRFPDGALSYWLSSFTRGLTDELIDIAVQRFAAVPSPMTAILFEHFHGAVTRVGATETPVRHRDEGWNLLIPSVWTDPADTEANIAWSRETFAAMRPQFSTTRKTSSTSTTTSRRSSTANRVGDASVIGDA